MKELKRKFLLLISLIFSVTFLSGCNNNNNQDNPPDIVEPCNHNWVEKVTKEGSCIEKEEITIYCSLCNEVKEIKEGEFKEHVLTKDYVRNKEFNDNNHFILESKCEVCNKVMNEEEVYFKDHHYELVDERFISEIESYATYKCLVCEETIEYHFNLSDFDYEFMDSGYLFLHNYKGDDKNLYIPNFKTFKGIEVKCIILYSLLKTKIIK